MRVTPLLLLALLLAATPLAGQVEFSLGGRLHIQYEQGSRADLDADRVFARRARLRAGLAWGDRLEARIEPEFADGTLEMADAWVAVRPWPVLRLSVGRFNRTLEIFELSSSNDLPVIERDARVAGGPECAGVGGVCSLSNLVSELAFVGREEGLRAEWTPASRFEFATTLTRAPEADRPDDRRAVSLSARATYTPRDRLALSLFHGLHSRRGAAGGARVTGADVVFGEWRDGPRVQGAVAWGDNWRAAAPTRFAGVHLLGSWHHRLGAGDGSAAVEPMLRVGWADGSLDSRGAGEGLVLTPGVAFYLLGRNRIAVNLDVADPAADRARWSLKVQSYTVF